MKVCYFTKYSRKGASSRLRSFQYFPGLKSTGVEVSSSVLFDDAYIQKKYRGGFPVLQVIRAYFNRTWRLLSSRKFDVIVIEKELFLTYRLFPNGY